jgi:hypothetical protein
MVTSIGSMSSAIRVGHCSRKPRGGRQAGPGKHQPVLRELAANRR